MRALGQLVLATAAVLLAGPVRPAFAGWVRLFVFFFLSLNSCACFKPLRLPLTPLLCCASQQAVPMWPFLMPSLGCANATQTQCAQATHSAAMAGSQRPFAQPAPVLQVCPPPKKKPPTRVRVTSKEPFSLLTLFFWAMRSTVTVSTFSFCLLLL